MLDGTHAIFGPEPWTDDLAHRLAAGDIHPTGPLWGRGELRPAGAVAVPVSPDPEVPVVASGAVGSVICADGSVCPPVPGDVAGTWSARCGIPASVLLQDAISSSATAETISRRPRRSVRRRPVRP